MNCQFVASVKPAKRATHGTESQRTKLSSCGSPNPFGNVQMESAMYPAKAQNWRLNHHRGPFVQRHFFTKTASSKPTLTRVPCTPQSTRTGTFDEQQRQSTRETTATMICSPASKGCTIIRKHLRAVRKQPRGLR